MALTADQAGLIERHLPLARSIARRYQGLGLDLEDLEQEAARGLCDAAQRYDPATHPDVSFAGYAPYWCRYRISEALATARVVHGSVRFERDRVRCLQALSRLEQEGHLTPTRAQIAERTGLDEERIREVLAMKPTDTPIEDYGSFDPARDDAADADPDRIARIEAMLERCSEMGKQMLILCGVNGLSVSQAARRLRISPKLALTEHDRACKTVAGLAH